MPVLIYKCHIKIKFLKLFFFTCEANQEIFIDILGSMRCRLIWNLMTGSHGVTAARGMRREALQASPGLHRHCKLVVSLEALYNKREEPSHFWNGRSSDTREQSNFPSVCTSSNTPCWDPKFPVRVLLKCAVRNRMQTDLI